MKKLFVLSLVILFFMAGCQKQDNLVNTEKSSITKVDKPAWMKAAERQGLTILALKSEQSALLKSSTDYKFLAANEGGTLNVLYDGTYYFECELTILPNTTQNSATYSLELDQDYLSLIFGPHPTYFTIPALLTINAERLDLSNFPAGTTSADLRYYNDETDSWELVAASALQVDMQAGTLKCSNVEIPHFSRWAWTR